MNRPPAETTTLIDIQALRGVAVLLVVYHARLGQPVAGYLGVDIFFIISGFLVTGLVRRSIERGYLLQALKDFVPSCPAS